MTEYWFGWSADDGAMSGRQWGTDAVELADRISTELRMVFDRPMSVSVWPVSDKRAGQARSGVASSPRAPDWCCADSGDLGGASHGRAA